MPADTLGPRLRKLRLERGLSLRKLAIDAGITPALLSQVERSRANPSLGTLRALAVALRAPLFGFFIDEDEREDQLVVRATRRRTLRFPDSSARYELLTPTVTRRMEMGVVHIRSGGATVREPIRHEGEECAVVLKGKVRFEIGERRCTLETWDSIYFDSSRPHRYVNIGKGSATVLFAVTPPLW